jgi:ribosome modulation factor
MSEKLGVEQINKAFNKGSDARLAGVPYSMCPYIGMYKKELRFQWQRGWMHLHANWGLDAKGRTIKELPPMPGPKVRR